MVLQQRYNGQEPDESGVTTPCSMGRADYCVLLEPAGEILGVIGRRSLSTAWPGHGFSQNMSSRLLALLHSQARPAQTLSGNNRAKNGGITVGAADYEQPEGAGANLSPWPVP